MSTSFFSIELYKNSLSKLTQPYRRKIIHFKIDLYRKLFYIFRCPEHNSEILQTSYGTLWCTRQHRQILFSSAVSGTTLGWFRGAHYLEDKGLTGQEALETRHVTSDEECGFPWRCRSPITVIEFGLRQRLWSVTVCGWADSLGHSHTPHCTTDNASRIIITPHEYYNKRRPYSSHSNVITPQHTLSSWLLSRWNPTGKTSCEGQTKRSGNVHFHKLYRRAFLRS